METSFIRRRLILLILLMLPVAGFTSHASAQAPAEAAFATAQSQFNQARRGEVDQLDAAIATFRAGPGNPALQPLYSVYLGSAITLKGKAAWLPWNKMKLSEQGLDQIDQALAALRPEHDRLLVQSVPLSLVTRLVAAATFVALPDGIFHRRGAGRSLVAEMRRSPLLLAAPAPFRAELSTLEAALQETGK
jgi:hypothetical protein